MCHPLVAPELHLSAKPAFETLLYLMEGTQKKGKAVFVPKVHGSLMMFSFVVLWTKPCPQHPSVTSKLYRKPYFSLSWDLQALLPPLAPEGEDKRDHK